MGLSLYIGKPITGPEACEMRKRYLAGQSINYIATAMGRSWTSANRYARGLSWIETRNPRISHEEHLRAAQISQRERRKREGVDECMYFLGPWL
jgi:hypothetical protein